MNEHYRLIIAMHGVRRAIKPILTQERPTLNAKTLFSATLLATVATFSAAPAQADVGIGADMMSRYIWRGTDFGDAVSIQPAISYTHGPLEIGAWAAYPITSALGANENDLYITYSTGPMGVTLTDYYFPQSGDAFNYGDEDGIHLLEIGATYEAGPLSLMAGFFFWGDSEDSYYGEVSCRLVADDEMEVRLTGAFGNGAYTTDHDPNVVIAAVNVSKGEYTASYILNPEAETSFLVFGRSF